MPPRAPSPAGYPSIYAGCHYGNCTTGSGLPRRVSESGAARSSVAMTRPGSGEWNASYDIWFDPTPRTDGQNTGAELMIWLAHRSRAHPDSAVPLRTLCRKFPPGSITINQK
ncbi:GH12 family glycosyl hydrolase domain-containing protein [Streptomyces sp. bgisy082]|uniref:GH12 family glycosyl hydrolase domain-containing protein n=1 Tax=unclassified Streptomyces TaxID=2593676 RepID=UPI003D73F62D